MTATAKVSKHPVEPPDRFQSQLKACKETISMIYVTHEAADHARAVLDRQLRHGKRTRESTTGYIVGYSRCGKTETIARFVETVTGKPFKRRRDEEADRTLDFAAVKRLISEQEPERYPPVFMQLIEGNGRRILYADMTNGITPLIASRMILSGIFGYAKANQVTEGDSGNILAWFMQKCHIDLFVLDEAQQMFRNMGPHAVRKFASWLLALENAGGFGIVAAGAPALETVFPQSDASTQRSDGRARLMPFPYKTEDDRERFGEFVAEFGKGLPFASSPLSDPCLTPAFFYTTRGRVGTLAKLAESATTFAFEDPKIKRAPRNLTIENFAAAFDFSLLNDDRMRGCNPFKVKYPAKLPTIPYSIDDELKELKRLEIEQKRSGGRNRGSNLWDP